MAEMGINEILELLPHRFPMLMVDKVIECDDVKHIVGIKNVTINEPFFQGHFPENPVMPGVLQVEAMAQVGGILVNKMTDMAGSIAFFLAIDKAKFRKMVMPGDTMRIEVELLQTRLSMCKAQGKITVNGEVTCEAILMFGRERKSPEA